jgi:hypothetical protein
MKQLALIVALLAGPAASAGAQTQDLGTLVGKWPGGDVDQIRVHFPAGELAFEPADGTEITAELAVRCQHAGKDCIERSRQLKLVTDVTGRTRQLRLEGMPKFNNHGLEVKLTIAVPKTIAVDADMGAGSFSAEGIARDLSVELGVGEVTVHARESDLQAVHLTVGIGDAALHRGNQSQAVSGILGRKVHWSDGTGPSHVNVELGVGDIDVRLN